jgi:hypothetical protein
VPAHAIAVATTFMGLLYALLALLPLAGLSSFTDLPPLHGVGIGILFAVLGPFLWAILESGELVVAREGLYLAHDFIPWSDVAEFRTDRSTLYVATPRLRRFWNSWTGQVGFPMFLFEVPPDLVDRLRQWRSTATRS